jgi:glycosyltransferase involved in cell wall biosynthesis
MEAVAMRTATRLIIDADAVRRFLQERHGAATPFSVVPYGADIVDMPPDRTALTEYGLQEGSYYLVVCRLEPENHVLEILRGYRSSKTDAPLLVIGDTATGTKYVRRIIAEADPRIRFLGAVYDRVKLRALRYYCRAYLHGHSVGGTNPSLLEALGCGNVVVAHDNVFNREVAGDAAYYFDEKDDVCSMVALVDAMPVSDRAAWADRSRQRIRDHYTWDRITRCYVDLLETDARSGPPRRRS